MGHTSHHHPIRLAARDALVLAHLTLVPTVVETVIRRLPVKVRATLRPDLRAAGYLGLLRAAERYQASRGVPFGAYARIRIRGAALDALRQLDARPRAVLTLMHQIETAAAQYRQDQQREPTMSELARCLGVSVASVEEASLARSHPTTLEATRHVVDTRANAEQLVVRRERREALRLAFRQLSTRERHVWRQLYVEGMTLKAAGRQLGVSESRMAQLRRQIVQRLHDAVSVAIRHHPRRR